MKIFVPLMLAMISILCLPSAAMPADVENLYQSGISAFKQGDYQQALTYLRQAEAGGLKTPNLIYNLGSTYYRLGRYREAEREFLRLADNYLQWRHLALYNLGRTAEARGDTQAARDYYLQAHRAAGQSKIRRLSVHRIGELTPDKPVRPEQWLAIVSVAAGYDDNAVLAPDEGLEEISEEGDFFTELYGFGSMYVSGDENRGIRLDGGASARLYAEETDYSYSTFFAAITRDRKYAPWQTGIGMSASAEFAGSDLFSVTPALELSGKRKLAGNLSLRLANTLSWVEGGSGYDYLTGIENRLTARLVNRSSAGMVYAGLGFEYNDRDDLETGDEFYSYSPIRGRVSAGMDWTLTQGFTLSVYGQYRKSLYPDENRMDQDGSIIEDKREDDRALLSVGGEYTLSDAVDLFAEYTHTDNDSNLPGYSYKSSRIMFGVQKIF